jgi:hypothetical protein
VSFIIRRALKDALERAHESKLDFESAQRAVSEVLQTSSDEATEGLRSFAKATSAAQQHPQDVEPRFKKGGARLVGEKTVSSGWVRYLVPMAANGGLEL